MSKHEPTDEELTAFGDVFPPCKVIDPRDDNGENHTKHALTAANRIRDNRIRNEALEEAAKAIEQQRYWQNAARLIRALKDKEPVND